MSVSSGAAEFRLTLDASGHRLGDPFVQDGREFRRCVGPSCGLVIETYFIRPLYPICPIEEADAEYAATVAVAQRRREEAICQWKAIGSWHERDLRAGSGVGAWLKA